MARHMVFLSTPSGWRATKSISLSSKIFENFYPRPPGGGRRFTTAISLYGERFLSTPSGWRATAGAGRPAGPAGNFYPRPPGGGRLLHFDAWASAFGISIHALRVEGDRYTNFTIFVERDFYPRPPGGGRLSSLTTRVTTLEFLSTPSGWRATECTVDERRG